MTDSDREDEYSEEEDMSDDDMGPGLHLETPEEIQRIEAKAGEEGGESPPKKTTRGTRSKYWKFFTRGPDQKDGTYFAICNYCGVRYLQGKQKGTSSMKNHITKQCKKYPRNKPDALQKLLQLSKDGEKSKLVGWVFDQMKCRMSLAKMVIAHEYPFNCVNHFFLRVFLSDLQPEFKIPSRKTLRSDCIRVYEEAQVDLYQKLGQLNCKFSFTSDLWSSKGRDRGFMAITCHFIDDSWKLRKRILTFIPLPSPHTGKHIAQAFYDKLVLWNLDKKAFYLVLDNASSNDSCVKELLDTPLKSDLPVDGNIFHQRCGCHILNLVVQDGLNVLNDVLKNIRDTMKFIRHSQSRVEKFKRAAAQAKVQYKKPAYDVPTRWNSTYKMLVLALDLKAAISRYATVEKNYTLNPTALQWESLEVLCDELKIFYDATMRLSGTKYPTLNLFFTEYCEVYLAIKRMSSSAYPFVVQMGVQMLEKFEKYWYIGNTLIAIACVLDPRCKCVVVEYYMKQLCPEDWSSFMDNLRVCMKALFDEYVEANEVASSDQNQATRSKRQKRDASSTSVAAVTDRNIRAGLKDYLQGQRSSEPPKSELEDYLGDELDAASVDDDFDVLAWWKLKAPKYPILSRLTRDILAVPISTVPSESAFSTSGRVLSPVRSSLNDESIEALLCAQDWLRGELTENGDVFGDSLWIAEEQSDNDA